jgi:hypothetical protein
MKSIRKLKQEINRTELEVNADKIILLQNSYSFKKRITENKVILLTSLLVSFMVGYFFISKKINKNNFKKIIRFHSIINKLIKLASY